jgi:hypothetical protein
MTQAGIAPDHAERALDHEVLPQRTLRNLQVVAVSGHRVVIGHDPLLQQPQFLRNTVLQRAEHALRSPSGFW